METYNSDIAPELLESLRKDFESRMAGNDKLKDIYGKVNAGTATYLEANDFALEAGNLLAEVFQGNLSESVLPDGRMYFNIADRVIRPMMTNNHALISDVCVQVQGRLNQKAGLGIKAIKPELNDDRIRGIVNKVSEAEHFSDVSWVLGEPMRTFSQSIVDDSIKANVDFQGKAGLYPKIERIAAAGCCEWCEEVAGTYRYPDVPKDVYRRHGHCRCTVDYDPADGKGQRQNVHTKQWESQEDYEKRLKRREIGLDSGNSRDIIEQRKQIGLQNSTKLPDEYIHRSVGAKSRNYDIMDLETGEIYHLAEGTYLRNKEVFAGKGSSVPYRQAEGFSERYGGNVEDWMHVKGIGTLDTEDGYLDAEIHWSECKGIGAVEHFIKRWLYES